MLWKKFGRINHSFLSELVTELLTKLVVFLLTLLLL